MRRHLGLRAASLVLFAAGLAAAADDMPLRLNDVQVIGSHNSYRAGLPPALAAMLDRIRPGAARALAYQHPPLARQLDLGVRQLEIDVFADPAGGRFADPPGERAAPGGIDRAAMLRPGFKTMHIPGLDYRVNCPTFVACLRQVREWSQAHPGHLPIFITIDAKDQPFAYPQATVPLPLDAALLDALDDEIRTVFPTGAIITPDVVRGRYPTLRDAASADGWPLLHEARGKVMIVLDVRRDIAERYRIAHPSLAGRMMFSLYAPDQPEAAIAIIQNPRGQEEKIAGLVRRGLIVRTRSDADTREARNGDYSARDAAVRSGAQIISTDYYPGAPDPERLGFTTTLPSGVLARCNPVRRPGGCALR